MVKDNWFIFIASVEELNINRKKTAEDSIYKILESFQLQMGFSFPFLRANDLRSYLFIMRTRSFLLSFT